MLADSHRYRISTKKIIKIGQAVSEEYGNENCDTRILYIRRLCLLFAEDSYNDLCEGVFHAVKCLYEKDPASFIFP